MVCVQVLCDQFSIRIAVLNIEAANQKYLLPVVTVMEPIEGGSSETFWIVSVSRVGGHAIGHAQAVVPLLRMRVMQATGFATGHQQTFMLLPGLAGLGALLQLIFQDEQALNCAQLNECHMVENHRALSGVPHACIG